MSWSLKASPYPSFITPVLLNIKQAVADHFTEVDQALYGPSSETLAYRTIELAAGNDVLYPSLVVAPFDSDVPEGADGDTREEAHRIILESAVRDVRRSEVVRTGLKYARILDALIEGLSVDEIVAGMAADHNRVFWQVRQHRPFEPRRLSITFNADNDTDLIEGIAGMTGDEAEDKPWVQITQLLVEVKFQEAFYVN